MAVGVDKRYSRHRVHPAPAVLRACRRRFLDARRRVFFFAAMLVYNNAVRFVLLSVFCLRLFVQRNVVDAFFFQVTFSLSRYAGSTTDR